jgi:HEAT repeat protein
MVPSRRLDDRIRRLCSKVTSASEEEAEPLLKELQSAIREKIESVRKLAARQLIQRKKAEQRRAA